MSRSLKGQEKPKSMIRNDTCYMQAVLTLMVESPNRSRLEPEGTVTYKPK